MSLPKKPLTHYWIQSKILLIFGSFLIEEHNTRPYRMWSFFNCLIFPPIIIPLGYTIYRSFPDITTVASLMGLVTGFLSSSFKLPTLHFRVQRFIEVRLRVLRLYERVLPGEEDHLERIVKFVQKLAMANGIALVFGGAILVGGPPAWAYIETLRKVENVSWPTPYEADYFVDMESNWNYGLVNLWCLYTIMLCVLICNCVDCIFFESCLVVAAHFRILQERFRKMKNDPEDYAKRLLELILYQKEIYALAGSIQSAYCTILCPFFIIASLMSCAEFYTATMVESWAKKAVYIGFSFSCLFQIFFYTYGGHEMILESGRLNGAIFDSTWYEAQPVQRKRLLLVMMRCQRECRITAGFFDVSMVTFSKILSSTFSYITLLKSMSEE